MKNKIPGREYFFSDSKYLKLDLEVSHEEIHKEVKALHEKFIEYRGNDSVGWYSLPIIGKSSTEANSWQSYFESAAAAIPYMKLTDIAEQCPVTVNWLKNVYPSKMYARVRFMLLKAGGIIQFHKDTEHMILGATNIAITNPKGCAWHWRDGETLEFSPGDAYAMNIGYEHSIRNDSQEDRYHIIVHHYDSTIEWKKLITDAMEKHETKGYFLYSTELF
jgi:quercetin dioxygenase-like cupin family protein